MENTARKEYEINKIEPSIKVKENIIEKAIHEIYIDARKENIKYLEDTKVEAGGE